MANPVVWFEVLGQDGANLQRFYADLFGWAFKAEGPRGYGTVESPPGKKGIPGGIGPAHEGARPQLTFYVAAPDLGATLAQAERGGGRVVMPPQQLQEGPRIAMFQDPEGHVVGLVEEAIA